MRNWRHQIFAFAAGDAVSSACFLGGGDCGTLLVPSSLNGATLNFITDMTSRVGYTDGIADLAAIDAVNLMAADMTLATGANPLSATHIQEVGAAGWVKLKLGAAVVADVQIVLWWRG